MWKVRKDEERPPAPAVPPARADAAREGFAAPLRSTTIPPQEKFIVETPRASSAAVAHIGKSVVIKGQLSGSEDLYLDGEVEGSIDLQGHALTIGPNGRIRAQIVAKEIVVHGKVDGNIRGERIELTKTALVVSDISTQRIVIEEGAFFKGSIDIQREAPKAEAPKPQPAMAAAASAAPVALGETKK
jgi:cytoskeletal protein CcmA (bactofilin family)